MSRVFEGVTAWPLCWPSGWKRAARRERARFGAHTVYKAIQEVYHQVELLGVARGRVILSTNLALRLDGIPYSGQRAPQDPGAAVYFELRRGAPRVLACDRWDRVEHNLWALARHVDAMRAMERWGVGSLEQAFAGFVGLPERAGQRAWWQTLGLDGPGGHTLERVQAAYRARARVLHPDLPGGSTEAMAELNEAREVALREIA